MKKTYSLDDLKSRARQIFLNNPKEQILYCTLDGQIFLSRAKNSAEMHARDAGGVKPLTVHILERDDVLGGKKKTVVPQTAPATDKTQGPSDQPSEMDEEKDEALMELLDKAVEMQIVKKAGNFYSFGDSRIGQGKKQVVSELRSSPTLTAAITEALAKSNQ
ncbi:MAG TPA: hypothetical protein P5531_10570 [Bacteroidales bacterium]|nr:hypothetical protein [Bacteroidales bacterium]HSA43594.1 hypothetical protein [Bacteroidales bacterium]